MRPRTVLIYLAVLIAALSLVAGGIQLAMSFGSGKQLPDHAPPVFLAASVLAVITALICIVVLDWVRNLPHHRRGGGDFGGDDEDEPLPRRGEGQVGVAVPVADEALAAAIRALQALEGGGRTVDEAIEGGLKVVAELSGASAAALWLKDEAGKLRLRAEMADGAVQLRAGGLPPEPGDEAELEQLLASRTPLEAKGEDATRFLFPLTNAEGCFGALRVVVPATAVGPEPEAAARLSARLGEAAARLAGAIAAPGDYERAVLDPVTGVYSARHMRNRLAEAASQSRRYGEPLSLVVLDVDQFKMLNATFGAAAGDRLLRDVATLVRQNVRDADGVYRCGADSLAVVLPNIEGDRARAVAERLCRIVRESRFRADDGSQLLATVSAGVAEFDEDMRGTEPLVERAEEALGKAKEGGRDRVQVWQPPAEPAEKHDA